MKIHLYLIFILLVLGMVGCAVAPSASMENAFAGYVPRVNPTAGQTAVVIQRQNSPVGALIAMKVWIDDVEVASGISNGKDEQIIVPNGPHTIQAGSTGVDKGNKLHFNADGQTLFFYATPAMGLLMARFNLAQAHPNIHGSSSAQAVAQSPTQIVIQTPATTPASTNMEGLPQAIQRVVYSSTQDLRERSRIAIMSVTAPNRSMSDFIAGDMEIAFRNNNYRIIDRSQLERIREEQRFQLSGEVDDNTAVSIGRIAGADYIVTSKVDGEGVFRRLRVRILDTQTAEVVGVSAEPF